MPVILEVKNLVKRYKSITAVDGVSFAIAEGACFGLLGPNGAGKTTTVEIIEEIIAPTSGQVLFDGGPRGPAFCQQVGIMFQKTALLDYLTVAEALETFQGLYPTSTDLAALMELCHLHEIKKRYHDRLSGGQRQRLLLALALINQPRLIFLDEPSTGLDPQARQDLWRIIQCLKAEGRTVVLTTHYMEEAQTLCDDIAIMDNGRIIARGSPRQLIERHCYGFSVILPAGTLDPDRCPARCFLHQRGDHQEIQARDLNDCLAGLLAAGVNLNQIAVRSPNLEDVFIKLTGRHLRE
jgi:ABC-2 type transport system ATP-binding protein